MTLGENIQQLRKRHGLSQDALAERLDVSRQAVSKWERDEAVPELDKLVALSQAFGITLDELVTGQHPEPQTESPQPQLTYVVQQKSWETRKVVAVILLTLGLLCLALGILCSGYELNEIIYLCPIFLSYSLVCFLAKKHPALACGWVTTAFLSLSTMAYAPIWFGLFSVGGIMQILFYAMLLFMCIITWRTLRRK